MSKIKKGKGRPPVRVIPHLPTAPEKLAAVIARDKHSPPLKKTKK